MGDKVKIRKHAPIQHSSSALHYVRGTFATASDLYAGFTWDVVKLKLNDVIKLKCGIHSININSIDIELKLKGN